MSSFTLACKVNRIMNGESVHPTGGVGEGRNSFVKVTMEAFHHAIYLWLVGRGVAPKKAKMLSQVWDSNYMPYLVVMVTGTPKCFIHPERK